MKKYLININGEKEENELTLTGNNKFSTGSREYDYEYKFVSPGVMVLRIGNNNYTMKAELNTDSEIKNTDFSIELEGRNNTVICMGELDILLKKFSKATSDKGFNKDVVSPMPGSIVKINVREGDRIKKGQVLLVLEAMKMENELKATQDCTVIKVIAEEKKTVDKGQILIKLEPVS